MPPNLPPRWQPNGNHFSHILLLCAFPARQARPQVQGLSPRSLSRIPRFLVIDDIHVMAAIGQFERALIGDRIRSGLSRAKALGKRLGRPRAPVRPEQVFGLRGQGLSYRAIGRSLGVSAALVHRLAWEASRDRC